MQFDLISDVHMECWRESVDWRSVCASQVCVVAGDLTGNQDKLAAELERLGTIYKKVLFVDGNQECHASEYDIIRAERAITDLVRPLSGVSYLRRESVIIDGTAFIGANGWWDFAFAEPDVPAHRCLSEFLSATGLDSGGMFLSKARQHAGYVAAEVFRLSRHPEVRRIVCVTHTQPRKELASPARPGHEGLGGIYGNDQMRGALTDKGHKVAVWAYGHNHEPKDVILDGVRYVSNPRGRPQDPIKQRDYRPLTITM